MRVTCLPCGPAANESERKALEHIKTRLQSVQGEDHWVLLANTTFSVNNQMQSDEIDIIVIGPFGIRVVEVKHWTANWFHAHSDLVADESEKVTLKARKVGTTLRKHVRDLPRVDGVILLSQEPSELKRLGGQIVRGVPFFSLNEWKEAVGFNEPSSLTPQQVELLASVLEPKSAVAIDGSLRRFAGYMNLELLTPKDQRFHRAYKGVQPTRQDRVVLHLYDLSASDAKKAEAKARREFEALQQLQIHSWAPRILDSFQDAPGYPGEIFFFSLIDPAAPTIEERISDASWDTKARIDFARNAFRALLQLHETSTEDGGFVHRNLAPKNILVKHDNSPLFSGFDLAKIPSDISIASSGIPEGGWHPTVAPEVRKGGLAAADQRSDVFSLCASLKTLFSNDNELSQKALVALESGMAEDPEHRAGLKDIAADFSDLLGESPIPTVPPPARYWTEDQVVRFRDRDYRIVSRLGSGGVGVTFKVVEIDPATGDELGAYVGKVAHAKEPGQRALGAYRLARSYLRHSGLSGIYEVAKEWQENEFIVLMTWVPGSPLGEFTGVFPLLAEEIQNQEGASEALAKRWLSEMCMALDVLHRNGLVHGDVSPRNMIVSGSDLVLTDYDFVSKIGEATSVPGTVAYSAPSRESGEPAAPSDDFFALASSLFHVIFDKEPFLHDGVRDKRRGLAWTGVDRNEYPVSAAFMERATDPDPHCRFKSAEEALFFLRSGGGIPERSSQEIVKADGVAEDPPVQAPSTEPAIGAALREEVSEWLRHLLQSYPGSIWGNRETRGLDTNFAERTFVETALETTLLQDILNRRARLVVLCGNAGDGKTALLQHLAVKLGLGRHSSSERIIEGRLGNGLLVRMNLDGSAAWRGRSADEILDEFLAPFQQGTPKPDIAHLLAINDGRLLEWIDGTESNLGTETPLTQALIGLLDNETAGQQSHIRFVSLNQRSLVGGISPDSKRIETAFLEDLLYSLYGGDEAPSLWKQCQSCSAHERCVVLHAARIFGPDTLPDTVSEEVRKRARHRLFEALQAVHLRGETHITVRELRAALVYILFGTRFCEDYHKGLDPSPLPYWDRAFSPESPDRQGGVLWELARFDPALEAHPQIDRYVLHPPSEETANLAPRYPELDSLKSARRRAYFEWTRKHLEQAWKDPEALGLARGRHLRWFRNLPLNNDEMDDQKRSDICKWLCGGISRLEDLPVKAFERNGAVPLRITPRTPTETAFWVEKDANAFRLEPDLPPNVEGMDRLHRQAFLIYRYRDGREERLRLGADLFHLLLELNEGYQLGDVSTDDAFAHLSIFVQRLVREDEQGMLAWNPMKDEEIFKISSRLDYETETPVQRMVLQRLGEGDQP